MTGAMTGAMTGEGPRGAKRPLTILQIHERFAGPMAQRCVRLMNHWGAKARHDLLIAKPDPADARAALDPGVPVRLLERPQFGLEGGPGRFMALAQLMRDYDLVLSFGWAAIDGVIAQRLFGLLMSLPPIIHHEDRRGRDEIGPLGLGGDAYRRMVLGAAHALVVPTGQLAHVAIDEWREHASHVRQIPDGIVVADYGGAPAPDAIPGLIPDGRLVLGARIEDAAPPLVEALLDAVAGLRESVRLVLLDAPGERAALVAQAERRGLADLLVPERLPAPRDYLGALDLFAMPATADPCPHALVEAMAAGLPVLATAAGDVQDMLASANRPYVVAPDGAGLAAALAKLAGDERLRAAIGRANRTRAAQCFDEKVMFDLYARLYGGAVGNEQALR